MSVKDILHRLREHLLACGYNDATGQEDSASPARQYAGSVFPLTYFLDWLERVPEARDALSQPIQQPGNHEDAAPFGIVKTDHLVRAWIWCGTDWQYMPCEVLGRATDHLAVVRHPVTLAVHIVNMEKDIHPDDVDTFQEQIKQATAEYFWEGVEQDQPPTVLHIGNFRKETTKS